MPGHRQQQPPVLQLNQPIIVDDQINWWQSRNILCLRPAFPFIGGETEPGTAIYVVWRKCTFTQIQQCDTPVLQA